MTREDKIEHDIINLLSSEIDQIAKERGVSKQYVVRSLLNAIDDYEREEDRRAEELEIP